MVRISKLMLSLFFVCVGLLLLGAPADGQRTELVVRVSKPLETLQVGETFTQTIEIRDANDLAGWDMQVVFNPQSVQIVEAREGDFLKQGGMDTFFQSGRDPARVSLRQIRLGSAGNPTQEVDDSGKLLTLTCKVVQVPVDLLTLQKVRLSNSKGERISYTFRYDIIPDAVLMVNPLDERQAQLAVGDTFTQTIEIFTAVDVDLSVWEMNIRFDPAVLEVVEITKGDFLESGGIESRFTKGTVYNVAGAILGLKQERGNRAVGAGPASGASGVGKLVSITFRLKACSEDLLGVSDVRLSNSAGERLSYSTYLHPIVATSQFLPEDVDQNGIINVYDLYEVVTYLGEVELIPPRSDVNDDGIIDMLDLMAVAASPYWNQRVGPVDVQKPNGAAPAADVANLSPETIQGWIDIAQVEDDGSAIFDLGIANLERLLAATVPSQTKLLLNYPNPFNPETWIPYQLATATDVSVSIYSVNGTLVRTLALGHQAAGVYQSKSQAAYWDGRNEFGEQVASGVYFYTLTAGDFSATGKMLVRK